MNLLARLAACALALAATAPAKAATQLLFNTVEYKNASLDALPQWQAVLERIKAEEKGYKACAANANRCASRGLASWQNEIKRISRQNPVEQVKAVNRFVNQWTYRADGQNYGKSDFWATPAQFFSRSGDCEDYAIAKYVSLRLLGFKADDLRLAVVKDTERNLAHAILAVYVDGKILILDNLTQKATPQDQIKGYSPYYSVNETARWAHAERATAVNFKAASASKIVRVSLKTLAAAGS